MELIRKELQIAHKLIIISVLKSAELKSPPGAPNQQPLSPYLLFHCHGGGYVATSSKSHEVC